MRNPVSAAANALATRGRLALLALAAACITGLGSVASAADGVDDDALPITLQADPGLVLTNHAIQFTGTAIGILNNQMSLSIEAPKTSPPQNVKLSGTVNEDGTFKVNYTPTVSGDYAVVVTGPDGKGKANAVFHAEDPTAPSPRVTEALPKIQTAE